MFISFRWALCQNIECFYSIKYEGKHSHVSVWEVTHVPHQPWCSILDVRSWRSLVLKCIPISGDVFSLMEYYQLRVMCSGVQLLLSGSLKRVSFFSTWLSLGFFSILVFCNIKKRSSREEIVHYSSCSRSIMEFSTDEETLLTELPLV